MDKTNYINDLWNSCANAIKTKFPTFNVVTERLNINDIAISTYYIALLYPRVSKLRFAGESYNGLKKRSFRIDCFCIGNDDQAATYVLGKLDEYVSHNQFDFSTFGLQMVSVTDGVKISDGKIYNSGSGNMSCYVGTLEGTCFL